MVSKLGMSETQCQRKGGRFDPNDNSCSFSYQWIWGIVVLMLLVMIFLYVYMGDFTRSVLPWWTMWLFGGVVIAMIFVAWWMNPKEKK